MMGDELAVTFLAQGEQRAEQVAGRLVRFIAGARRSLDIAIYDIRLSERLADLLAAALHERARAGVVVRIAIDTDKPPVPRVAEGMDPAPPGSEEFVATLGLPFRRIGGLKLMHHKYIVRDAGLPDAQVWTGSANFTDDSWTLQENNIVVLSSLRIAGWYRRDFDELWRRRRIDDTGEFDTEPVALRYAGRPARVHVQFSPGCGPAIDYEVARRIARARRRVRICSMLLNSGALLSALGDLLRDGRVPVDGIYDQTQMEGVFEQWRDVPHNRWKIGAVHDIVREAGLVGKISTPYSPDTPHDFMHSKVLVVDDTVITGSYNFSHSAEMNAENILTIESRSLAAHYSTWIDHLIAKYGG